MSFGFTFYFFVILYYALLYYVILCSIVFYCIVLYCVVLYCIVLYCIVLYCIVLYCIVLYCIVLYCHRREERRPCYSFASVVRLASFRYRRLAATASPSPTRSTSTSSCKPEDAVDEPIELPAKPRFCATLSAEAQYAMLKGYEDILREKLTNGQQMAEAGLLRVRTPQKHVVCLHLTDAEPPQDEVTSSVPGDVTSSTERPVPKTTKHDIERKIVVKQTHESRPRRPTRQPSGSDPKTPQTPTIPKQKQLRLSYRFERAMDLVDCLKAAPKTSSHSRRGEMTSSTSRRGEMTSSSSRRGEMTSSPSRRGEASAAVNPVDNYNRWSRSWVREFKLEYSCN